MNPLLSIEDLRVSFGNGPQAVEVVRGLSFSIERGRTLSIVGESGSGKSMTSLALMNLLPRRAHRQAKRMDFAGTDLLRLDEAHMSDLRGSRIAMIFQEPMTSLNPVQRIGHQLEEAFLQHRKGSHHEARERALYLLDRVGIVPAARRLRQFPHEMSGGLRQRAMIAMALMCGPEIIIADEPTTALDVTIQAQVLRLLRELQREFELGVLLITHDLGVVARTADLVAVMYAGRFVETGTVQEVFKHPLHPYTQGLIGSMPRPGRRTSDRRLDAIPGMVPSMDRLPKGCAFSNRCSFVHEACLGQDIAMKQVAPGRATRCVLPIEGETGSERQIA